MTDPQAPPPQAPTPKPRVPSRAKSFAPSLNFLLVLLVFAGTGALLWHDAIDGRLAIFVFVISGWIVSLCLHEFAHALTAYLGGDASVAETGYLDLDPLRYTDPTLSLMLPILFVAIGGFGLPGGLVYIRTGALRSKLWRSAVSAAGPLMSIAFLIAVAILYAMLPEGRPDDIASGLGILAFFEATSILLCLLPFPGLDGFGIIRPYLRPDIAVRAEQLGAAGFYILFFLIWLTPLGGVLFNLGAGMTDGLGIDLSSVYQGYRAVRLKIF